MINANTVKPMILSNTSSSIVRVIRALEVSRKVWSGTFFSQNRVKNDNRRESCSFWSARYSLSDLYEFKGTTVNNINLIFLVAIMCNG